MTDSAFFDSDSSGTVLRRAAAGERRAVRQDDRWPGRPTPAAEGDRLWCEHGWGLSGAAVAALVGLVLLASCVTHLLG